MEWPGTIMHINQTYQLLLAKDEPAESHLKSINVDS